MSIRYFVDMQVCYHDECKWEDVSHGMIYHYVDADGKTLAEVALKDGDAKLWKFEVMLPAKYRTDGRNPAAVVYSQLAAKRIAEMILLNTIVTK